MNILLTGAAGFIGSNLVRHLLRTGGHHIVGVDKLTYAGSREALADCAADPAFVFVHADICDGATMADLFGRYRPAAVLHLAAESHVDRSIGDPEAFIQSNIVGTWRLLECCRGYWGRLAGAARDGFRFVQVSTDEVYGSLGPTDPPFTEQSRYDPHSPYSASKAAADHLVRSWQHTYGLPAIVTNSSNNYGPWQHPEKLVPVVITQALRGAPIPVYGSGEQVRDWLHVDDHCRALELVLERAAPGTTWNMGGQCEVPNIELIRRICRLLDELVPGGAPHERLIRHVEDRPGHDWRYALDSQRLEQQLGWRRRRDLDRGLRDTVVWYLQNRDWWESRATRLPRPGSGSAALGDPADRSAWLEPTP